MYITPSYVCFSCNLLVYKTKHCFEINDITKLTKSRHAGVNPGFCIHFADDRKVSFFSFFDRDKVLLMRQRFGSVIVCSGQAMALINRLSKSARETGVDEEDEEEEEYVYEVPRHPPQISSPQLTPRNTGGGR